MSAMSAHALRRMATLVALAGPLVVSAPVAADDSKLTLARQRMIRDIESTQREVAHETGSPMLDRKVLAVMGDVPRHLFVPRDQQDSAYENRPLPIGYGQTISQPYIVALMTDLLRVTPGDRVLELGTGSGYQAAVFAKLAKEVFTVEIVAPLGKQAAERLAALSFANVQVKV